MSLSDYSLICRDTLFLKICFHKVTYENSFNFTAKTTRKTRREQLYQVVKKTDVNRRNIINDKQGRHSNCSLMADKMSGIQNYELVSTQTTGPKNQLLCNIGVDHYNRSHKMSPLLMWEFSKLAVRNFLRCWFFHIRELEPVYLLFL